MAKFEDLVSDVYELFNGSDLSSSIEGFKEQVGKSVVSSFKKYGEPRQPKLYLSNLGKPLRQLWYDLKGFKGEPLSAATKFKFGYGDYLELLFMYLAEAAGHKVTDVQKRVEIDGVSGKIDGYIDGVLVDVKSCSSRSFDKFKQGKLLADDPFGYVDQLTGYKKALDETRAAFIAIDKVSGEICVYELPTVEYDLHKKISDVQRAINSEVEPLRCYPDKTPTKDDKSGNRILSVGCGYCSHKSHCWRDANNGEGLKVRFYSTGPKWFTSLVKEPNLRNNYNNNNKQGETFDSFPSKTSD